MVQLWGLPEKRIITRKQINPSCRCVLICNESVFGSSEILLLWCISSRVWADAVPHPSNWIFLYLKIMILCGTEGPAKGGSFFKMAFARWWHWPALRSHLRWKRSAGPPDEGGWGEEEAETQTKELLYVSNAAHYCVRG